MSICYFRKKRQSDKRTRQHESGECTAGPGTFKETIFTGSPWRTGDRFLKTLSRPQSQYDGGQANGRNKEQCDRQ